MTLRYPAARRDDLVEDLHGRLVADPYRWLEDAGSDETTAWSAAQDELYTAYRAGAEARAAGTPFEAGSLEDRLHALLGAGAVGAPACRGERYFQSRREPGAEHAVVLVVEPDPGAAGGRRERVLIDPMALDPAGTTTLDSWQPSKEGRLLAYQVSTGGTEESVLRVLDVDTGQVVEGPIDRARYSPVAWLPGGEAFFYVRRLAPELVPDDERQFHRRVWLHRVGTSPDVDVEVFGAGRDLATYYGASVSRDGRWLIVSASVGTAPRTDVWIADLAEAGLGGAGTGAAGSPATGSSAAVGSPAAGRDRGEEAPSVSLREVAVGLDAEVGAWMGRDGMLYVHTNLDAPRGRLCVTSPGDPGPATWRTLLPEDPEAVLEDVALLDGGGEATAPTLLLASWRRHAVSEVTRHDPGTGALLGPVALPGLGSVSGLVTRPEGGSDVWFSYADHVTVPAVHRFSGATWSVEVWARPPGAVPEVPSVRVQQLVATSTDGTAVRAFVVALASSLDDEERPLAPAPTILYGYGGFQVSLDPAYSAGTLAWVEAGGVYVVANLRGGGEEGEAWHRAGMRGEKQNAFDDFFAVAQLLVAEGWTTRDRLACWGGSNGGLLVGAAVTQRPELFAAGVCSAPLLDMVRYQLFGLGRTWTEEYGATEVAEELGWLLGYSPYHAVRAGTAYPATLFTVFEGDTRVDPLHARKTAAAMQAAIPVAPDERPVLLRRETGVGHGGRALSRSIALTAEQLRFVADRTGLLDAPVHLHADPAGDVAEQAGPTAGPAAEGPDA
jgi:prolyl oligopeptidase